MKKLTEKFKTHTYIFQFSKNLFSSSKEEEREETLVKVFYSPTCEECLNKWADVIESFADENENFFKYRAFFSKKDRIFSLYRLFLIYIISNVVIGKSEGEFIDFKFIFDEDVFEIVCMLAEDIIIDNEQDKK